MEQSHLKLLHVVNCLRTCIVLLTAYWLTAYCLLLLFCTVVLPETYHYCTVLCSNISSVCYAQCHIWALVFCTVSILYATRYTAPQQGYCNASCGGMLSTGENFSSHKSGPSLEMFSTGTEANNQTALRLEVMTKYRQATGFKI